MKTKGGVWVKRGRRSSGQTPGSYGDYVYERAAPKSYKTTGQQKRIGDAGREVGAKCTGKKGSEFKRCRHEVMKDIFG